MTMHHRIFQAGNIPDTGVADESSSQQQPRVHGRERKRQDCWDRVPVKSVLNKHQWVCWWVKWAVKMMSSSSGNYQPNPAERWRLIFYCSSRWARYRWAFVLKPGTEIQFFWVMTGTWPLKFTGVWSSSVCFYRLESCLSSRGKCYRFSPEIESRNHHSSGFS